MVVPHRSFARMEYNRGQQVYEGQFLDGTLVVDGRRYHSLSKAASALAKTKRGNTTSLNGWKLWWVKFPESDSFVSMEKLRLSANIKCLG